MADRKTKYTLEHILPERKDSYESFYKAINPEGSSSKERSECGFYKEGRDSCCPKREKEK